MITGASLKTDSPRNICRRTLQPVPVAAREKRKVYGRGFFFNHSCTRVR